jgi:hypothetical protein
MNELESSSVEDFPVANLLEKNGQVTRFAVLQRGVVGCTFIKKLYT